MTHQLATYLETSKPAFRERIAEIACWLILIGLAVEIYYLPEFVAWIRGMVG